MNYTRPDKVKALEAQIEKLEDEKRLLSGRRLMKRQGRSRKSRKS